jgi:hypothetical protein
MVAPVQKNVVMSPMALEVVDDDEESLVLVEGRPALRHSEPGVVGAPSVAAVAHRQTLVIACGKLLGRCDRDA